MSSDNQQRKHKSILTVFDSRDECVFLTIHSDCFIVPLQVHYYSEALQPPLQHPTM